MARARTNPWLVLLVLTTGFFMIMLDTTIVNVAIPAMSTGLNTTLDQILWVLNAYVLVYAVLLITAGRLGDLYGQRNLFAIGLFIFTIASALCGLAQNPEQLIAARVLQGVGGALLTPQTLAILTSIFPPERRGAAFGIWGGVAGLATVAGPTVGGAIITYIDWRWIFFINVPIGIAALIATFLIIPDLRPGRHHGWDFVGTPVATAGLFAIVFGLIEGQRYSWGQIESYPITIPELIGAGVVLMVLFVIWERFQAEPLVPLSLFADRNFTVANWIAAAIGIGMTFAPMTTVAMRNIEPRVAGAASSVLNTIRQLGAAIGSAVIGAILQNQLATTLHSQAVSHASALPPAFRDQFIAAFTNVSSKGFEIGAGESGARLPSNIPPAAASQIAAVAHDVFVFAYIDAMKATFVVPIAFLAFTAVTALLIRGRPRASSTAATEPEEELRAAAG